MEHSIELIDATPGVPDSPSRVLRSDAAPPEIAVFGEWNTADLGDWASCTATQRFFEDCGWAVRAFHLGPLSFGDEPGPLPGACAGGPITTALGAAPPPVKRSMRGIWHRVRMLRLLPRLEHVQAIAVGGGKLLSDDQLRFPQSLLELGRYARALHKPLLCLGCRAEGPWSARGWRMIREFLEACSVLAVRDADTAARLAATLGAAPPVFGDFCLSEAPRAGGSTGGRHQLAIDVSRLAGRWAAHQQALEDALVAVAKGAAARMAARGIGICFFTTAAEDAPAASRVHAQLEANGARLYLPASPEQLAGLLRTACAVVATRPHAAMLALAGGVPVVGLGVSSGLRDFFSTMSMGRYCYETSSSAQLADWVTLVNLEVTLADQKRALARSAVWKTRADIRERIASLAAAHRAR